MSIASMSEEERCAVLNTELSKQLEEKNQLVLQLRAENDRLRADDERRLAPRQSAGQEELNLVDSGQDRKRTSRGNDILQPSEHNDGEGAVGGPTDNLVAEQSCVQMGYSRQAVNRAVGRLKKEGKTSYHAQDILLIVLEMEENGEKISDEREDEVEDPFKNA